MALRLRSDSFRVADRVLGGGVEAERWREDGLKFLAEVREARPDVARLVVAGLGLVAGGCVSALGS